MERINPLKKNSLALESAIKKAFEEAKIEKFNFYRSYIQPENLENRIKNATNKENKFPFVIIRPVKSIQKAKGGFTTKVATFLIRLGTENKDYEEGFYEIAGIAEYLIAYFTKYSSATQKKDGFSYSIDLENIESYLNEEITGGDYWVYDILLQLNIPTVPHTAYIEEIKREVSNEKEEKWQD